MSSQDVETLKLLFKISPESTSCEISQLMQFRCYEVSAAHCWKLTPPEHAHLQVYSYRSEYHRAARAQKEQSKQPDAHLQCIDHSPSSGCTYGSAAAQPDLSRQ